MFVRYALLTTVILLIALATGYVVHRVSGTTKYIADCQFQVALPVTSTQPSSDILVFNRRQAYDEIVRAQIASLYDAVSKDTGIPVDQVASAQTVNAVSDSSFGVDATHSSADGAITLANSLCTRYVQQVKKQLVAERQSEINGLNDELRQLEKNLAALNSSAGPHPSGTYFDQRAAIVGGINRTKDFLIATYGLPGNDVSVLSPAQTAAFHSTKPSVSKSLIIAAAAGLLVSFLLILGIETVRGRRDEGT